MQHTLILIPCKSGRVTLLAIFQPLSWTLWILTVERGGSKLTWDKVVQNDSWDLSWTVGLLEMGLKSLGKQGLMSHKYPSKIKTKSKDLNSPKLCSIHVLEELLGSADTVAAQRQTPIGDEVRTEVVLVHQGENLLWQVRCIDQSVSRVKERKNFSSNTPSCLQPTHREEKTGMSRENQSWSVCTAWWCVLQMSGARSNYTPGSLWCLPQWDQRYQGITPAKPSRSFIKVIIH